MEPTPPPSQKTLENNKSFSHDVNQMPDCPPRNPRHRRAHSEILSLPDDLSFDIVGPTDDSDNYNFNDNDNEEEDLLAMYLEMDKIGGGQIGQDNDAITNNNNGGASSSRVRHQHSQSMDGSEMLIGSGSVGPGSLAEKKAMSDAKLADLALVDPKRAKRIWANRQSAARSKERKMRYIGELERKVQTLQTESTTLSAQLSMLQRDTTGLTSDNSELKMRVQTMEQQVHLQDAVNDALREEVQRLKLATGQMMQNGPMMNFGGQSSFGANQQFHNHHQHHNRSHNQAMQSLIAAQQLQQLQIRPQHQQPLHQNQHYQQQQQQQQQQHQMRRTISPQTQRENNSASME